MLVKEGEETRELPSFWNTGAFGRNATLMPKKANKHITTFIAGPCDWG